MPLKPLSPVLAGLCLYLLTAQFSLQAQNDSSHFSLGRFAIDRNLVQHTTISAKELHHFPFTSLDEAVNLYFFGTYSGQNNIRYVVDGNLLPVIDAISIYDIDSITLIQNAQTLLNSSFAGQDLILIQTKSRDNSKNELRAAVSGFLTKTRNPETGKFFEQQKTRFYQQYYVGGSHVGKQTSYGGSLHFLRTAYPLGRFPEASMHPSHIDNIPRASLWLNMALGKRSTIRFSFNGGLADTAYRQDAYIHGSSDIWRSKWEKREKQLILSPSFTIKTQFSRSLTNEASLSYSHVKGRQDNSRYSAFYDTFPASPHYGAKYIDHIEETERLLLFRNHLGFEKRFGAWTLQPALDLFLAENRIDWNKSSLGYVGVADPDSFEPDSQNPGLRSGAYFRSPRRNIVVSPTISLDYKKIIFIQSGSQYNHSNSAFLPEPISEIFPFISASLDILKPLFPGKGYSLKLFVSQGTAWSGKHFRFDALRNYWNRDVSNFLPISLVNAGDNWAISRTFGANLHNPNDIFSLSYTFQQTGFTQVYPVGLPSSSSLPATAGLEDGESDIQTHRFTFRLNLPGYNAFLNVYNRRLSHNFTISPFMPSMYRFVEPASKGWSGGWVNHFTFNKFSAGINAMYFFDEDIRSLLLQHLYLGYNTSLMDKKTEIYLSGRNLLQNKESRILTGYVAYFGFGINMML